MLVKQPLTTYLPAIAPFGGQSAIHSCVPNAPPGQPPSGPPNSSGPSPGGVVCITVRIGARTVTTCIAT